MVNIGYGLSQCIFTWESLHLTWPGPRVSKLSFTVSSICCLLPAQLEERGWERESWELIWFPLPHDVFSYSTSPTTSSLQCPDSSTSSRNNPGLFPLALIPPKARGTAHGCLQVGVLLLVKMNHGNWREESSLRGFLMFQNSWSTCAVR